MKVTQLSKPKNYKALEKNTIDKLVKNRRADNCKLHNCQFFLCCFLSNGGKVCKVRFYPCRKTQKVLQ